MYIYGVTGLLGNARQSSNLVLLFHHVIEGKRMERLMHNHGQLTPPSKEVPRVKVAGEANYDLDKGMRMSRLIHEYQKQPQSARPQPRVKPGMLG